MIARNILLCFLFVALIIVSSKAQNIRQDILLNNDWRTTFAEQELTGVEKNNVDDNAWKQVDVPHNWESYEGYRRLRHGNKHGTAWYRNKFTVDEVNSSRRYFLWFEGVGSYATVWVNGKKAGYHAGGRTSFTIDITGLLNKKGANVLAMKVDHPADIRDLPWVCGGCSEEVGFSEGSQPLGIFRPVHLIITSDVRVQPFGIHAWNDTTVSESEASVFISAEIKNYGTKKRNITVAHRLLDASGKTAGQVKEVKQLEANEQLIIEHPSFVVTNPHVWSLDDPYLYTIVTEITEKGKLIDRTSTTYGIRWIRWDVTKNGSNRFFLNGRPVFINGTAEYEHIMGKSHAFTDQQIKARALQIQAAGFNAFRDAHQPHNLRYQQCWDSLGLLSWTQFSSHIWFDSPGFKENFKTLLREWVKERRNSPSIVLWGLQNESHIPEAFARECTAIIRAMDPTTSTQRKVTTCNGGAGTDWNVPQNWSGTYGGDPNIYDKDIQRQTLVGEYGGWRSLGFHKNTSSSTQLHSEEELNQIMETKIRLAESVKEKCSGHFQWLFSSHENPGRVQGGEGFRETDRVGPVNYKGLFTSWGEPSDAYYLYRANYAPKEQEPMVYIVSHTWTDRWITPGKKDSVIVYSNCDSIELFNDIDNLSLGVRITKEKELTFNGIMFRLITMC